MSIEGIIIGLLAVLIGAAWATYGLKAFTVLLPIWAFFVGLLAGAHWGQEFLGEGFFGTVTSWVLGFGLGLILALLSYFWYYGAIALLGGAVGYTLGAGLMEAIGFDGFLSILTGLVVGALFAVAVIILAVPVVLVIVLSAFGGAAAVVNGVLILLGQIPLDNIDSGLMEGLMRYGAVSIVGWLLVAAAGIWYQLRDIGRDMASLRAPADIDRSAYRI
jgi:hypothetical protein